MYNKSHEITRKNKHNYDETRKAVAVAFMETANCLPH